jgi:malate/lactate dehydrogenase
VAVLGAAGLIGSGVAAQLALGGQPPSLYLHDARQGVLEAHVIDLTEAAALTAGSAPDITVVTGADALPPVDLVVIAASAGEGAESDRSRFLGANLEVLAGLAPHVARCAGRGGVVLMLSNPVDVLAGILQRLTGLSPERIVGYSLNDSVRFRAAIGRELGVPPGRVEAWVLGEHGTGQVPLFSRVMVDRVPTELTPAQRSRVRADIDGWFARWARLRSGRSSGWTTPIGVGRLLGAMAAGDTIPASVHSGGLAGIADVFLGLPARLSPRGLAGIADWPLDDEERTAITAAAVSVRAAVDRVIGGH